MKLIQKIIVLVLTLILSVLPGTIDAQQALKADTVMLPNGWQLTPAGKQLPLGDLPLNIAVSPNKRWLAVTNNGYGRQCVQMFDTKKETMTADITLAKSWYGLCFAPDNKRLYVSGGNDNIIWIYNVTNKGGLQKSDSIVMGKPWPVHISPTGMIIIPRKNQIAVVTKHDYSLYIYDLKDKHLVAKSPLGGEGYDILLSSDQKKLYASCWGCDKVKIWDIDEGQWSKEIAVGSHPNEMCLDSRHQRLFVANANDNSVSVINLQTEAVEETLNAALFHNSLSGSTTNGLAVTPNGKKLAIANADNNCVTMFDISLPGQSKCLGFIPVGWYPTNVKCIGNKLWVTNGKGLRSMPNPEGPQPTNRKLRFAHHKGDANRKKDVQYIAGLFLGALSIIDMPDAATLQKYSAQVYCNTPYQKKLEYIAGSEPGNPIPAKVGETSPIKYVFYVIKENRTYDQVLGDMKEGNGDSTLVLFGEKITPNLHAIARQFVLLDNFYVNAEVSCDGHNWTMGAYANDYLEKTWPSYYSSRGDYFSGEGHYPMGNNKSGFFWDACKKSGVSYRSYGEFATRKKGVVTASLPCLVGHVCPTFEPWDLGVRDTVRFREWKEEFEQLLAEGKVPHFNTVRMGSDHTEGMTLGRMTPFAHAADNDLAVGMFIDYLSHSPIWRETAVFVIEDDAQNGADHVDAHRSTAYIAGGFVKRNFVDHTPYTTSSMIRTMELILGIPPMTQYDASARSMWRCFSTTADMRPYTCLPETVSLNDVNVKQSKWQAMSENYDFTKEDNVPDVEFNQVLWHGLKGDLVSYPPIHRSAFLTYTVSDDDDD
jgi:YVTN family beta-propeller protein